jgi:two-component system chemotaxis sensor kinase CheA
LGKKLEREPMLEMFIFETLQLMEQLEQIILNGEKQSGFADSINEIFRIMHTVKGTAAMMLFNNISALAHSLEDLFFFIREENPARVDFERLSDIVLAGIDFIKNEIAKLEAGEAAEGDGSAQIEQNKAFLARMKEENPVAGGTGEKNRSVPDESLNAERGQKYYIGSDRSGPKPDYKMYRVKIVFEPGCLMESTRSYILIHNLQDYAEAIYHLPADLVNAEDADELIVASGLQVVFQSNQPVAKLEQFLRQTAFMEELEFKEIDLEEFEAFCEGAGRAAVMAPVAPIPAKGETEENPQQTIGKEPSAPQEKYHNTIKQNIISINLQKLDFLMDLVGELVISEAMVTHNPELDGLPLDNFYKASRQLKKIIGEIRDVVMDIRMVPLGPTFQKMNRLIRDMSRKLGKDVDFEMNGTETEVDKSIIDQLADPLMHLIRNSMDHGLENAGERLAQGKPANGKINLEARNEGSYVCIVVKDDGRGLNKEKILEQARRKGLIQKPESELTDKEIFSFILLPGFSTKEQVSEYSGRGVGMDVVTKNIEKVGGAVLIDSAPGEGSSFILKIPLTLAIINGMTIRVGNSLYTVATTSIKESFRPQENEVFVDPDGNEMIMIRGECYPIVRLHEFYKISQAVENFTEGILMMVENEGKTICLFADELLGEQQVVVKTLPQYIKKVRGIAGCTLLGDGGISLILDVAELIKVLT